MTVGTIHPGYDLEEVKSSTGFELNIPNELKETIPPTVKEIQLLRDVVDPFGIRKLEVLSGSEREELIDKIISRELERDLKLPQLITSKSILN